MLFADLLSEDAYRGAASAERRAVLEEIVADFRRTFPDIHYELRLQFRIINAQAVTFGEERCVIIYGGLGYHPQLRTDALIFVLLHETGHHLASGRRLAYYRSLACECASDHWAVTEGAKLLEAKSGRRFQARRAVKELGTILEMERARQPRRDNTAISETCWNAHWPQRWRAIVGRAAAPEIFVECNA